MPSIMPPNVSASLPGKVRPAFRCMALPSANGAEPVRLAAPPMVRSPDPSAPALLIAMLPPLRKVPPL